LEEAQDLGDGGGGWGSDAPRALLALQLANCSWVPNMGMKAELAAVKLELQVALLLWRYLIVYLFVSTKRNAKKMCRIKCIKQAAIFEKTLVWRDLVGSVPLNYLQYINNFFKRV